MKDNKGAKNSKVYIETLGCPKNFNDSEVAAGILEQKGYVMVDSPEAADYIMVNTCGFINDAKKESIGKIFDMAAYKQDNNDGSKKLIVSGCLSQRYAGDLAGEMPEVDAFLGVNEYERLPEILAGLEENPDLQQAGLSSENSPCGEVGFAAGREGLQGKIFTAGCNLDVLEKQTRKFAENPYSATIKIAEGCNNICAYCIIPKIRGKYRSKREEDILAEARELAAAGCKELILIAQDVTYYGMDLYGELRLPKLLRELCKVDGIQWIRLMYCYEDRITDELIKVIASEEKICNYLDIPIQHASDRVLKAMNRRSTAESIDNTLSRLKESIPDIRVRTTLIVGFPGESEEDFDVLCDFVEGERFARLGVFAYSQEENTVAGEMGCQIDEEIKQERLDAIMRRQLDISLEMNRMMVGETIEVIVDQLDDEPGSYIGRSRYDAPEIDNSVIFTSARYLKPGDIVKVYINDAFDYDLVGTEV